MRLLMMTLLAIWQRLKNIQAGNANRRCGTEPGTEDEIYSLENVTLGHQKEAPGRGLAEFKKQ
jgi:hypothetical protein